VLYYERKLGKQGYSLVIGVDEAGRGPLAGPVVAAAVLLKKARFKNRIDDSKKLTSLAREQAFREITRKSVFGIGIIDETENMHSLVESLLFIARSDNNSFTMDMTYFDISDLLNEIVKEAALATMKRRLELRSSDSRRHLPQWW